jgi:hypothetical protein
MKPYLFRFPLVLLVGSRPLFVTPSLPREDWSTLDLAELEEEWRIGDHPEDLLSPDDHLFYSLERERQSAYDKMQTLMRHETQSSMRNNKALERAALDAQNAGKSVMMFATLRNDRAPNDGDGWIWDSMATVCEEWSVSPRVPSGYFRNLCSSLHRACI